MTMPFVAGLAVVVALAACSKNADLNGPGITPTADISGKWAGHGDGANSFDSLTATFAQQSNGSLTGGGVYWLANSPTPVKIVGARVSDSVYVSMPDSTGSTPDTLRFLGIVSKDSFGDELFGSVGRGTFTAATGITFTLHRRT